VCETETETFLFRGIYPFDTNVVRADEFLLRLPTAAETERLRLPRHSTSHLESSRRWERCPIKTGYNVKHYSWFLSRKYFRSKEEKYQGAGATRDKGVRIAERNFNVSRSERKKTITTDSDDRSGTSECDADEQKDESEVKRREYARREACQLRFLKYSDPKSIKKSDWIRCQRNGERYREIFYRWTWKKFRTWCTYVGI